MLKETNTEETIGFFVTFLSLVAFQLGGQAPWLRLCFARPMFGPSTTYIWIASRDLYFKNHYCGLEVVALDSAAKIPASIIDNLCSTVINILKRHFYVFSFTKSW